MLIIRKNQTNNLIATASMNKTLPNPYYLFSFQHIASKERISFIPQVITSNVRYDKFRFVESQTTNLSVSPPQVNFFYEGQYYYSIYEQISSTNTNIDLAFNKLESGRAVVIVGEDQAQYCYYEPYVSQNETFENVIYISEQEQICQTGTTDLSITGSCPLFLSRQYPENLYFYDYTGNTTDLVSSIDQGCAPTGLAMTSSKIYMVDGCSNYHEYNYSISSGGTFSLSYVRKFRIFDSFPSVNANAGIAIKDANTLLVVNTPASVGQTGTTIYEYNLTTSATTKYIDVSGSSSVNSILYNTGNTQMVIAYSNTDGSTGRVDAYSGTNLTYYVDTTLSPLTIPKALYWDGTDVIGINLAGIRWQYDFFTNNVSNVQPDVDFDGLFAQIGGAAMDCSCLDFDITPPPPTPSPTVTMTPTPTSTCPVTTQYLEVELFDNTKFKLILWNDSGFTSAANALCDYQISGTAYGSSGTTYTGVETIVSGQHQHQFNLSPVLLPGEVVNSFDVWSYSASTCVCPVNLILPSP